MRHGSPEGKRFCGVAVDPLAIDPDLQPDVFPALGIPRHGDETNRRAGIPVEAYGQQERGQKQRLVVAIALALVKDP